MNRRNIRLASVVAVAVGLLCMAGCGVPGSSGGSARGTPAATSPPTASPAAPYLFAATPSATGPMITAGQITVTLDKATYAANDAMTVYVNNGLSASIEVADHQTACTIVTMQRSQGGSWQAVAPCRLMVVTRILRIPAYTTTVVRLEPAAGQSAHSTWPAGTYCIALYYGGLTPQRLLPVYSAQFEIR